MRQQPINGDMELPAGHPAEACKSDHRADQTCRDVQVDHWRKTYSRGATRLHCRNSKQRNDLHDHDEWLVQSPLARLVPALHRAPDGYRGSWNCGQSTKHATEKSRDSIADDAGAPQCDGPPDQHVRAIDDQDPTKHTQIGIDPQIQKRKDAAQDARCPGQHERSQQTPLDVSPQHTDAQRLVGQTAEQHDLHDHDVVMTELKQHRPA
jgi:hypothetical protein